METAGQLSLPIFTAAEPPASRSQPTLPPGLIDATSTARVAGFRCGVAITQSLDQALGPDAGKLGYYEKLLIIMEVAHLQFSLGGRPVLELCCQVSIPGQAGEWRRQLYGRSQAIAGEPWVIIGTDKNV